MQFFEAAPEGDPAGFAIAFATEEAAKACEFTKELVNGDNLFAA